MTPATHYSDSGLNSNTKKTAEVDAPSQFQLSGKVPRKVGPSSEDYKEAPRWAFYVHYQRGLAIMNYQLAQPTKVKANIKQ